MNNPLGWGCLTIAYFYLALFCRLCPFHAEANGARPGFESTKHSKRSLLTKKMKRLTKRGRGVLVQPKRRPRERQTIQIWITEQNIKMSVSVPILDSSPSIHLNGKNGFLVLWMVIYYDSYWWRKMSSTPSINICKVSLISITFLRAIGMKPYKAHVSFNLIKVKCDLINSINQHL